MAYNKTIWVNGETPVDADNMNNIENGISSLDTNKLDKSEVVNTKTESEGNGKALNAVQSNPNVTGTLAQQINALSADRGYLNSKNVITSTDDCTLNGKYYGSSSILNLPESYSWVMDVIRYNDNFIYQTIQMGSGKIFFRLKTSSGWQTWQEIATTTKTPFSCTASTGYTIVTQNCYFLNGEFMINIQITKTDSSEFAVGFNEAVTMPFTTLAIYQATCMGANTGAWIYPCNGFTQGNTITVMPCVTGVTKIYLTVRGGVA